MIIPGWVLPPWLYRGLLVGGVVALGTLSALATVFLPPLYLLVLLVALLGLLTLLVGWPVTAFALLWLSALFTRYRVEVGTVSVRAEHVAVLVLVALGFWQAVWHRRRPIVSGPGLFAIGWLAMNLISSLVNAPEPTESLKHTLRLTLVVLSFFLTVNLLQHPLAWR